MAEWLVEDGIGETRAILLQGDSIRAARMEWSGALTPGQIEDAKLISRASGSSQGLARFASGEDALVERLPRDAAEGAPIRLTITRPAMAERGRHKRARARPTNADVQPAPSLANRLQAEGASVRIVPCFPACDWDDLVGEAFARETSFPGGQLLFSATPAMSLIDVDGSGPATALAQAAARAVADALRRFDLGGSIGVDFPTLATKDDRRTLDQVLAEQLADWPHERTAMNGFGFVQIIARLERVSLLHRASFHRVGMAARLLLRRAERVTGAGTILLTGHPALEAELRPEWLEQLQRRTGRPIRWQSSPTLALEAPQAQLVAQ
ncbi:ribonuclease [Altererythrobacter xixiisoli]|uniref:Ribonuclease n=1 Tax=Croceibacterium xixiisoli TaxID=1476466 RepID=A0A6I4TVZ9_9SPHN|nr:ribonuclease E/G [Croceibacterium xixiisoli]MXO98513.1 ribonuclease [Croceibacterium xixiisoli]